MWQEKKRSRKRTQAVEKKRPSGAILQKCFSGNRRVALQTGTRGTNNQTYDMLTLRRIDLTYICRP